MRKLRLLFLRLLFIPIILVALFVRPNWPEESLFAFNVELVGYFFLLIGLGIRVWSIFYIGGRKSHTVISDGPYSLCRNPLYIGTFFLTLGVGLCFENPIMLALCLLVIIPAHLAVVKMEESHLESLFGQEYRDYKQRVPRYWPRFSTYSSPATVEISVKAIRRIILDTLGILLLPEIEDLLEILHQHDIIPVLFYFPK